MTNSKKNKAAPKAKPKAAPLSEYQAEILLRSDEVTGREAMQLQKLLNVSWAQIVGSPELWADIETGVPTMASLDFYLSLSYISYCRTVESPVEYEKFIDEVPLVQMQPIPKDLSEAEEGEADGGKNNVSDG